MSSARLFDVRVLLVGFLVAAGLVMAAAVLGAYNHYIDVGLNEPVNGGNFPKCDNGDTFFLTHFFQWVSAGEMFPGQDCRIAGVSAEIVAQWTEQELIDQGIDPMMATPAQIEEAKDAVLLRWAAKIIGR